MIPSFRTSGTTGAPKPYTLTDAQIAARVADLARVRPPRWVDLASYYNDFADRPRAGVYRDRLWAQEKGATLYRPLATFAATVDQFITNNVQGIFGPPLGLKRIADEMVVRKTTYRPLMVVSSGQIMTPEVSRAIRAGLGDALWTIYSSGESGSISMATAAEAEATLGCVGMPFAGVEVQIVEGEIQVKTPIMIAAYDDPKDTAAKFTADGWFRTGDKGSLAADGSLMWEGRL